ncbi:MAG TPA: apolipoprotein N-acyltransferase, partial [Pyrinomonadaceae bacterium]|nr:apolipoprotein N-acyltransferase [Pyrinomonadaceae bacterium]
MQDVFPLDAPASKRLWNLRTRARASVPSLAECGLAVASAVLLILSFPDFNLWPLAWVGFAPLMVALVRVPSARQAFLLSWMAATLFFYGTCYWLTHAMVHYGNIPRPLAYLLLVPGAMIVGLFPALWAVVFVRLRLRAGVGRALLLAPSAWTAFELARLGVSGQLWNAVGYSQAYVPVLVQPARWGGVYAVGFLIVTINAALAFLILRRNMRALLLAATTVGAVAVIIFFSQPHTSITPRQTEPGAIVVAIQPNVSANFGRSLAETNALVNRHLEMSAGALREWDERSSPQINNAVKTEDSADSLTEAEDSGAHLQQTLSRVVVWPESPMNFTYATNAQFREMVARFARTHRTSVLFNSLEPAPAGGVYNSAVLINEEGRLVAQYDKIRLLPFGEYVPLPRWLPLTWLLTGIVGE